MLTDADDRRVSFVESRSKVFQLVAVSAGFAAIGGIFSWTGGPESGRGSGPVAVVVNEDVTEQGPTITVRSYDPSRGAVADIEGGDVTVSFGDDEIVITGNPAGLRDLARWCLVISDEDAPPGAHVHLDPNVSPLTAGSLPILITRE